MFDVTSLVRHLAWLPAAALALMGCAHTRLVPLRPEQYPGSGEAVARGDVNGDGYEDALFKSVDNCGSSGCGHVLWVSSPTGHRAALVQTAALCEVAPEVSQGFRDVRCVMRVVDQGTLVNVRAAVRYRWNGQQYVSQLAHLDNAPHSPKCQLFRARRALPLWLLPARDVSVSLETPKGWEFGPSVTPQNGKLEKEETFESDVERVDAAGEHWTEVPGRGWVESKELDCAK